MVTALMSFRRCSALMALAISFYSRCSSAKDPWEVCENKVELQETDATKGIHDYDVCQLRPGIDVPESERPARLCTAHLVLVEGQGQAVVPATCFLPDAPDQTSLYLRKQDKGWAFQGKLSLTCGPHMYSFHLQSTFAEPKVLLHPSFVPEKKFAQLHNFAVVRISREDYAKATEEGAAWEFARLSETAAKTPSAVGKCRCYAGTSGAPGSAEPPEYPADRCQFPSDAPSDVKQQTCLVVKRHSDVSANDFHEIYSLSDSVNKHCGMRQTMSCFCGSTAEELRTLHSIGSFVWKRTLHEVTFFSIPLKDNWEFLRNSVHESAPIGATDVQLETIQKHLGESVDNCVAGKKGGAMKTFVKKYLCDPLQETASKEGVTPEFMNQLEELSDCLNQQTDTMLSGKPEAKGRELMIPPFEQATGLAYRVVDKKICAATKIIAAARRIRIRLTRKIRCFSLAFRVSYSQKRHDSLSFAHIFGNEYVITGAAVMTGIVPTVIGGVLVRICDRIKPGGQHYSVMYYPCMIISHIFLLPTVLVDGVVAGVVSGGDAAVSAIRASGLTGKLMQAAANGKQ